MSALGRHAPRQIAPLALRHVAGEVVAQVLGEVAATLRSGPLRQEVSHA